MRKIYEQNKTRIVKRFSLFPTLIDNEKRWLEMSKIEQRLVFRNNKWVWANIQWIN